MQQGLGAVFGAGKKLKIKQNPEREKGAKG